MGMIFWYPKWLQLRASSGARGKPLLDVTPPCTSKKCFPVGRAMVHVAHVGTFASVKLTAFTRRFRIAHRLQGHARRSSTSGWQIYKSCPVAPREIVLIPKPWQISSGEKQWETWENGKPTGFFSWALKRDANQPSPGSPQSREAQLQAISLATHHSDHMVLALKQPMGLLGA